MKKHWEGYGNTSSHALEESWGQMAEAFLTHVKSHDNTGQESSWTVLSLPTGTGKSEGMKLYCAMLSGLWKENPQFHPGVLIVTRMILDAEEIAQDINKLSRKHHVHFGDDDTFAVAYHSEVDGALRLTDLKHYPVLAITHKAYEHALDGLDSNISPTLWDYHHIYLDRKRKLVIIDEVADLVLESRMGSEDIRRLIGTIPDPLFDEFRDEMSMLELLQQHIRGISEGRDSETIPNSVLQTQPLLELLIAKEGKDRFPPMFRALRNSLIEYRSNVAPYSQNNRSADVDARRGLDDHIRDANAVLNNPWLWQTKHVGKITLNTAKLLIPQDVKGAVILDATAGENVFYDVFPLANRLPLIAGTRRYDNVCLHVGKGHATGKFSMSKNAEVDLPRLVAELEKWGKGHSVLIIAHQIIEDKLSRAARRLTTEKGYTISVAHWGAIRGKNDWQDFDTVVLYGLHHLPPTWPVNVFFACQGVQSDQWLSSTGNRPFGKHRDIKGALNTGQLVTDVIQAINRVRCRKVVDALGNCDKTDVFILLPTRGGKTILSGILNAMPGAQVVDWNYADKGSKPQKTKHDGDLIKLFRTMKRGQIPVTLVKEKFGITDSTFERIRKRVGERSPMDPLGKAMIESDVTYNGTGREGKTPRALFIKKA
jgi:hypothetical protein